MAADSLAYLQIGISADQDSRQTSIYVNARDRSSAAWYRCDSWAAVLKDGGWACTCFGSAIRPTVRTCVASRKQADEPLFVAGPAPFEDSAQPCSDPSETTGIMLCPEIGHLRGTYWSA